MAVTMAEITKLRKISGAGMMDCKNALNDAEGDFDKAMEIIRKKGQAVAAKRSERDASEGCVLAMTNAVELLRKDFYRKGVCVIADIVKTRQEKTNNKRGIGNRGKTKIVVKEHFSEKGKTMEELLTDVMLEKAKQTIA